MLPQLMEVDSQGAWWDNPARLAVIFRFLLVAAAVLVCFQFEWRFLRYLTSETVLQLSTGMGLATQRLSFDTIEQGGRLFTFTISCTFADVWSGSLPLLWRFNKPLRANVLTVVIYTIALFAFNILRLEIGQLLYAAGVPWIWIHEIPSGFAYFLVWVWLSHHNGWSSGFLSLRVAEGNIVQASVRSPHPSR